MGKAEGAIELRGIVLNVMSHILGPINAYDQTCVKRLLSRPQKVVVVNIWSLFGGHPSANGIPQLCAQGYDHSLVLNMLLHKDFVGSNVLKLNHNRI